ncbi:Dbl-like domain-containing protein [Dichomitus squalens LYAD-421 SS1]|uniref:Dbl-like domain-containing protein n=1 Tax=Dichomitus squalens (strain LYAD-421) TaxID=732165 RepID=R7T0S5_DICSQ|nr:Dbl-like domain-containing protein [Dichomitus squalens LYAD-421 SS1]EJF60772.1 Dbl-like domain-containing protein [Dichomitus squalens LYAD-421 SS1]
MAHPITKRGQTLLDLLESERKYVIHLMALRDLHLPLASGQRDFGSIIPRGSRATFSTISDISFTSLSADGQPPMTEADVKAIFNNIAELATFSEQFVSDLECALGDFTTNSEWEDYVGKLFLTAIPLMEPLYKAYARKQSSSLERFNNLSRTPAFNVYLARTQVLTLNFSDAWDLPSLLLKPAERLTQYPMLLHAIISETPDSHPDKANLMEAHARMEQVKREIYEERRRREVVRDVLTSAAVISTPQKGVDTVKAKKSTLSVGVAASVSRMRMKSFRSAALKTEEVVEANMEAVAIKAMGEQLKSYESFVEQLARDSMKWADSMKALMCALDQWARAFGRVVWMGSDDEPSEAFDAFLQVIRDQLPPICDETKDGLRERLLPLLTSLVDTMVAPMRLMEAMHTLEPLHYGLLYLNVAKSRPPPQVIETSKSYVALRTQLFAELPTYLSLIDKGMAVCIRMFNQIQRRFYNNVRKRCTELRDTLAVDEAELVLDTRMAWRGRFVKVEAQIQGLRIWQAALDHRGDDDGFQRGLLHSLRAPSPPRTLNSTPAPPPLTPSRSSTIYIGVDNNVTLNDSNPSLINVPSPTEPTFRPGPAIQTRRESGVRLPSLYECRVVHSCEPPEGVEYRDLPFFTLRVDDVYGILQEMGHPSMHRDLPLYIDDGEDCLLLARDQAGDVGWVLASFLTPSD